ncbi:MAG TPA: DUF1570 domain-containing protein [Geothrix sp.]|nr:DUF1570 domain-containing protein [Geothrix sp.]
MPPARCSRSLLLLLLLSCGQALLASRKEAWVEVRSPHFVAYSDAGEAEARKALAGFEGIRSVFGTVFPDIRVDPPKPMILLVTRDEASMKRFVPDAFLGEDPKRSAGVFLPGPDRNYAILRLDVDLRADQPYFVLFHEYTHGIVRLNFPSLPVWLDEGIADFYGATEIHSERVYLGRVPKGRLERLRSGLYLPLETLLKVTHDSPFYQEGEKTGIFYAESWALVHYLFTDPQARKAGMLQAYMKALTGAVDPLEAARAGFGDLKQVQESLTAYARRSIFTFWDLPLAVKLTDKEFRVRALDEAEALVVRAEFLMRGPHEPESRPLLDQALALAPERPEVQAAVQAARGEDFLLRGEREKARQAFEAALRLGSQDFRVPYELARLAQGHQAGPPVSPAQILAWLDAAEKLRPDFPGLHMARCRQYADDPRDPDRALAEGRAAVEAEPQNLATRANFGSVCMSLDLEAEAKLIGQQLGRLAATSQERAMVESYTASLAQFLERRKAEALVVPPAGGHGNAPFKSSNVALPLKFTLSSHLAPLGQEVMRLAGEGKTQEAIRRVEKALAKADNAYDRKTLRSLLDTLRARIGQTGR